MIPTQYKPFQINKGIFYEELAPSIALRSWIAFFWRISNFSDTVFNYLIIPDGTVDIIADIYDDFNLKISVSQPNPIHLPLPPHHSFWGVRLYPSVFTTIFKNDMSDFKNTYWFDFQEIIRDEKNNFLSERLFNCPLLTNKKQLFETYFQELLYRENLKIDNRFLNALQFIYQQKGIVKVEKELEIGISSRQLRRLFDNYIGFSPKSFAKIVQTQHTIQQLSQPNFSFFDAGFYDQMHFIKTIKSFTGLNPTDLRKILQP